MALKGRNLFTNLFHSNRSSLTCTYKCGNACFGECGNKTDNEYFGDMTRRTALKAGGLSVLTVGGASLLGTQTAAAQSSLSSGSSLPGSSSDKPVAGVKGLDFENVAPNTNDAVTVPAGYTTNVLIAWGDPVYKDAPEFDINNQTAAKQEQQFGFNNDFAGLIEHPSDPNRMIYMCSHEYTTEPQMIPNYDPNNPTEEQVNIGLAAHGHTILEVSKVEGSGELKREFGRLNRRITAQTPFKLVGPAAGTDMLKTNADPAGTTVLGTLNNCAGGVTPWGTMLSGEENIDQYFTNADGLTGRNKEYADRIGVDGSGQSQRGWELYHDRFDLSKEPNEVNRFGYIVEIDPTDPESTPIKHTSMGRFKHEAGNVYVTKDGTVVCYSGDDERFEYIYKFVSSEKIIEGDKAHNMQILDYGTLYVATLEGNSPQDEIDGGGELPEDGAFDGTGVWHPLLTVTRDGATSHIDGFTAEEVAVYTRLAADKAGATKMDRPEDFEANPNDGKLYVALTNNSYRGATGANASKNEEDVREWAPIKENKNGLVMEIEDDHAGTKFTWNIFLVCGDPDESYSYFGGFDKSKVSPISCPDNVAFDSYGNLWISTDGNALGSHDGLYAVPTTGPNRGELKCFLTVPTDAETCGPIVDDRRVMVNVQHPGEGDTATVENPSSHWPEGGNSKPRPAVAVTWKTDGGKIGF
ncbi:PhoX family protein [Corynebacterium sp. S7]